MIMLIKINCHKFLRTIEQSNYKILNCQKYGKYSWPIKQLLFRFNSLTVLVLCGK